MSNNAADITAEIILKTIKENNMLVYGDRIVTGVSGGADSMCLLHFLVSHAESFSAEIIAAHVNHNLRGDEAMRDQKLVEKYCASLGIKCEVLSADINSISEKTGESCEECGRRIRYEFFERLCGDKGKIATAHTLSDSAETVIFNTVRGTGLKGLTGIPKIRGNIIRPLIEITRFQVEEYCRENGISYVTDSTNLQNEYNRNKIRNIAVPVFREINSSFEYSVKRLSDIAAAYLGLADSLADEALEKARVKSGSGYDCSYLKKYDITILRHCIIKVLSEAGCSSYEERHIRILQGMVTEKYGVLELPKGFICSTSQGVLRAYKKRSSVLKKPFSDDENNAENSRNNILFPKTDSEFIINNQKIMVQYLTKQRFDEITNINKLLLKNALDCDIIQCETQLRVRMEGDSFRQRGRGVTKTLRKLFNEAKIPAEKRKDILLLANGNQVIWLDGFGVSQEAAVKDSTKEVVLISKKGM